MNSKLNKAVIIGYHEIGCIIIDELIKNGIKISFVIGDFRKSDSQTNTWYRDIRTHAKENKIKVIATKGIDHSKILKRLKVVKPDIIFSFELV